MMALEKATSIEPHDPHSANSSQSPSVSGDPSSKKRASTLARLDENGNKNPSKEEPRKLAQHVAPGKSNAI